MRPDRHVYIVISCWLLINGIVFYFLGIKYAIDTMRFEAEADAWLNGNIEASYLLWYSGYTVFLSLSKLVFHSIYPTIVFQYVFSLTATVFFYRGLATLLKNKEAAFIATLLVIMYIPIQQWNTCLLTESVFISVILLFVWAFSLEKTSHKWFMLFSLAVLAALTRPNGGIVLLTCCCMYGMQFFRQAKKLWLFFITGAAIILFLLNSFTDTFYQFLLDSFNKGEIICGYDQWTTSAGMCIADDPSSGSIAKIVHLVFSNPAKSMELFTGRFAALWMDVRSYYSLPHNVYIVLYLLPAYVMAIIGFIQYKNAFAELALATLLYGGINSMLVMLTYADWDGRFLAPLLPVVFIWAGLGSYFSIRFLKRKYSIV
jgi:hypothetical protein